jgi:hypothetical protein
VDQRVQERIARFQSDLLSSTVANTVQRHITFGEAHILDKDSYFGLKCEVAGHFALNPHDVVMVGSGKLGFSIVANKRYRPFTDTSDIDLAIINPGLFDQLWVEVFDYQNQVGYWPDEAAFSKYLFRGWIRPDKLPPSKTFRTSEQWFNFFRELSASGRYGPYKLAAGLYRSMHFMETYVGRCADQCRSALENTQ